MQLRYSGSQRHTYCLPFDKLRTNGSMVLADHFVCGFPARNAGKPHTIEKESTVLPKAQCANCESPTTINRFGVLSAGACVSLMARRLSLSPLYLNEQQFARNQEPARNNTCADCHPNPGNSGWRLVIVQCPDCKPSNADKPDD
jgi:hypothetical protein